MPGMNGLDTLAAIREVDVTVPVAMISGHGTITDAMQATRLGAFDFIEKPFTSERVLVTVKKGLEVRELRQENRELKLAMESKYEMIGDSPALRAVLEAVRRAAPTSATVLLLGESGVGKELVARAIHRNSPRAGQRFVQVNCAAIPEELIESELFGHEKGSFTGATEKQIGKFEQADQGTIFLDEIGDMSSKTQAKVLRVLQEQEVERLGSTRTIKLDVRVIAATNKNLEDSIARGEFRDDLYFRLNVIPIAVPPLRERRDDIERLANHFAKRISEEQNFRPRRFDARAMRALRQYRWRGNIRELRNTVERLMIMTAGETVQFEDLPLDIRGDASGAQPADSAGQGGVGRADVPGPADAVVQAGGYGIRWIARNGTRDDRHVTRVQGRRGARLSGAEASRESLEYLEDRRSDRHAQEQPVQEARAVPDQAGPGRLTLDSASRYTVARVLRTHPLVEFAIMDSSQSARRPLLRLTAGNREVAGGEESPNSEGQCAG